MTATITHTTAADYTIDLVNGFRVEVCARCGGRGVGDGGGHVGLLLRRVRTDQE